MKLFDALLQMTILARLRLIAKEDAKQERIERLQDSLVSDMAQREALEIKMSF
jgi:hypothetical protein